VEVTQGDTSGQEDLSEQSDALADVGQEAKVPDLTGEDLPLSPDLTTDDNLRPPDVEDARLDTADIREEDVPVDPCLFVSCVATCHTDADCAPGDNCLWYAYNCCSQCQPFCELCYFEEGTYCPPDPSCDDVGILEVTEVGTCWFDVQFTGSKGTDVLLVHGCFSSIHNLDVNGCNLRLDEVSRTFHVTCNWCGEVLYTKENCLCAPDCAGKQCGPDGCGGTCGSCQVDCVCTPDGQCAACGDELIELEPLCAHAPSVVQAGQPFGVAIYGLPGCSLFHHYDVDVQGNSYKVKLMGTASFDPDCPPLAYCSYDAWSFLGFVWLDAPNPGSYTVKVGKTFSFQVGASGGMIAQPNCDDACPITKLEHYHWTLKVLANLPLQNQCLEDDNNLVLGVDLDVQGACQTYLLGEVMALPQMNVNHCTEGHLYFGTEAPYWMEARICGGDPMVTGHLPVILGTMQGAFGSPVSDQFFLVEGVPLWN
jgi:hypothetical protein